MKKIMYEFGHFFVYLTTMGFRISRESVETISDYRGNSLSDIILRFPRGNNDGSLFFATQPEHEFCMSTSSVRAENDRIFLNLRGYRK